MKIKSSAFMGAIISVASIVTVVFTTTFVNEANSSKNNEVTGFPVNAQGQTYGQGPYTPGPANEPDLIKSVGEDGVVGYVKSTDLAPTFSSTEEALAFQKSVEKAGYKSIPLYKSDGKTVIGEFRVYPSKRD